MFVYYEKIILDLESFMDSSPDLDGYGALKTLGKPFTGPPPIGFSIFEPV